MVTTKRFTYVVLFAAMAIFGVSVPILGAALPALLRELNWRYVDAGIVLAAGSAGYFLATLAAGFVSQHYGVRGLSLLGAGLQVVGLGLFGISPSVLAAVVLLFVVGVGHGFIEVTVNSSIVRLATRDSRIMNLMHGAFTVGAILGPIGVSALLSVGADWRWAYRGTAFLALVLCVLFIAARLPAPVTPAGSGDATVDRRSPLLRPLLLVAFLALLVYVGIELGVSAWSGELMVAGFDAGSELGAQTVALFWLGLLLGRFGLGVLYRGDRYGLLLLILSLLISVGLLLVLAAGSMLGAAGGIFLAGLGCSAYYPVVVTLVGREFPRHQGVAVGFIATGGGIGSFTFPFIMAAIADVVGVPAAFRFFGLLALVLILLSLTAIAFGRQQVTSTAVARSGTAD